MPPKNSNATGRPKAMPEQIVETESHAAEKPGQFDQPATALAQQNTEPAKKAQPKAEQNFPVIQKPGGKLKSVRDTYTMSEAEYAELNGLKERCLVAGLKVKRSELLRAGLRLLQGLSPTELNTAVAAVQLVKLSRAKNKKKRTRH